MVTVLVLLMAILAAKIVLIDSPVGAALGDAIRNMAPAPKAPSGAVSAAELDALRSDVEELRERVERVVEEQEFITRLLSESDRLRLEPGEVETKDL